MSFEAHETSSNIILERHPVSLAGYNFIYSIWKNLGKPLDGWVAQKYFIKKELKHQFNSNNDLNILIPTTNYQFYLEELWGWTYGSDAKVDWSPLLFVGREIRQIEDRIESTEDYLYQFMYLQGDDAGWIFGAGGPNTSPLLSKQSFDWFSRAIK